MPDYTREQPKEVSLPPRLPLIGLVNQRAGSPDVDSRLVNGYVEIGEDGQVRVVKRPGFGVALNIGAAWAGLGSFYSDSAGNLTVWEVPIEGGVAHRLYTEGLLVGTLATIAAGSSTRTYFFEEVSTGAETTTIIINSRYAVHTYNPTDGLDLLHFRDTEYLAVTCSTTSGSAVVTTASTALLTEYTVVTGAGIPADTQIDSIDSATQFTMSQAATATDAAAVLDFALGGPPSRASTFSPPTIAGGLTYRTLVGGVVDLNKSVYLLTYRAEIAGSDIDKPRAWNPLNSLYAYAEQDQAVCIAKQMSYIIAFKSTTTEFFRDAGNSPGSPLERVEGLRLDIGCYVSATVQFLDGLVIWASNTASNKHSVWALVQARPTEIASPAVARMLETYAPYRAFSFSSAGHTFYVLNAEALDGDRVSLVYDTTSKFWSYWNALGETYLPFTSAVPSYYGPRFQHESDGKVYLMEPGLATDDGSAFDMDIFPPEFDANVRLTKYLSKMYVVADQEEGSILRLRVNDDNQHPDRWSSWREFDLSEQRPRLDECGSFYKRAFHFRHSSPTPCRLVAVELDLQPGTL
jgi:hypothetical protein